MFFVIAQRGRGGAVIGGILIEVLLIVFVQDGLTKRERLLFSLAAVGLGFAALAAGTATS